MGIGGTVPCALVRSSAEAKVVVNVREDEGLKGEHVAMVEGSKGSSQVRVNLRIEAWKDSSFRDEEM